VNLRHLYAVRLALAYLGAIFGLLLAAGSADAAHTRATLVLGAETVHSGDTLLAGIQLRMDPGWHTYWQNSGASGMPTTIEWKLPPGISAGAPQWPIPEKLPDKDLTTYIYRDEVVILVPLKLAPNLASGDVHLSAKVSWLECAVQCVPGQAEVGADLKISAESRTSAAAALLDTWKKKLPKNDPSIAARGSWEKPATGDLRPVLLEWNSTSSAIDADFFPDASEDFEVQGAVENLSVGPGKVEIRKDIRKVAGSWPTQLSGLLVQGSGDSRIGYQVKLDLEAGGMSVAAPAIAPPLALNVTATAPPALWKMLFYAFVGGLILNVMPCVLPVIALKILGFVGQAKDNPARARFLGLVYAAGVLVSFLVLAALVLGIKAAGHKAGWGIQFSSPYFLVAMTTLVTLIALNLFGVFEVYLGARTMDAAANLSSQHGTAGAFFNGLLATVLATSCTAPFLGAAVGFAFAPNQTATTTLLVFVTVGAGLAFPYVLLTWQPAWLKFLPKPGLWMERFKVAMGFPMLAAAVWLFSLVTIYYAERSWWLAIFLVMVAVAAWIYGEFVQRHRARPGLALVAIIVVLFTAYGYALEGHLRWRDPILQDKPSASTEREPGGIAWKPWSVAAVEQARAEHRPVLVDFTAKWCLTCNTVVKPALESSSVREKLRQANAVGLIGDYTRFPEDITEELSRHGRAGVPLVLVYPANRAEAPIVLPEALTPGMVVNALDQALQSEK
jgi:thiol:disulfide interchange protein DsbD